MRFFYSSKEGSFAPRLVIQTASGSAPKTRDFAPDTDGDIAGAIPERNTLSAYPNPWRASSNHAGTQIVYQLRQRAHVKLAIYDLLGREVRILISQEQDAGSYEVRWNGRDANGRLVPSAVYLYAIEAGEFKGSKKLLLVR
jgi:hypothetical protein